MIVSNDRLSLSDCEQRSPVFSFLLHHQKIILAHVYDMYLNQERGPMFAYYAI
jgi:hypothetical protein